MPFLFTRRPFQNVAPSVPYILAVLLPLSWLVPKLYALPFGGLICLALTVVYWYVWWVLMYPPPPWCILLSYLALILIHRTKTFVAWYLRVGLSSRPSMCLKRTAWRENASSSPEPAKASGGTSTKEGMGIRKGGGFAVLYRHRSIHLHLFIIMHIQLDIFAPMYIYAHISCRSLVHEYAKLGAAHVVIISRNREKLEKVKVEEVGHKVSILDMSCMLVIVIEHA